MIKINFELAHKIVSSKQIQNKNVDDSLFKIFDSISKNVRMAQISSKTCKMIA